MFETLVRLSGVSRSFASRAGTVEAMKHVSCGVSRGERIAIMGASGSGKSTLLSMMCGLDEPDAGSVEWPGSSGKSALRPKRIGIAFQTPSLIPSLTARQNIEVPLLVAGADASRGQAAEVLEQVGLSDKQDRFPDELSGGQAQRVALARALVSAPQLIVADEPTGQLDQETGSKMIKLLFDWSRKTGGAVVVATHDQHIADQFDAVWHMNFGALELGD